MLASEQIPQKIADLLLSISTSTSLLLFLISIFVLIAGMVLDNIFVLIVFSSLFLPTMKTLGVDPVHFGIVMTMSSAIGALTPPVGGCLFIVCVISKLPMEKIVKEMIPFLMMLCVALFVVVFFPQFSTLLPRLFYGK
jgi:TRAP-type C4-dicarboxylate transport system permease large subunit